MANKVRGEIEIDLAGRKYTLRPDFEGMLEAEDRIGKPLPVIFLQWGAGRSPSLREVVSVIYGGLLWDTDVRGRPLTFEEVGRRVVEHGHHKLMSAAVQLVRHTLVPPKDESEEEKPGAKKKPGKTQKDPQAQSPGANTSPSQS